MEKPTIIQGLKVEIPGQEIHDIMMRSAVQAREKAGKMEQRVGKAREVAKLQEGQPSPYNLGPHESAEALAGGLEFLKRTADRYELIARHVDKAATYLLHPGEVLSLGEGLEAGASYYRLSGGCAPLGRV